MSTFLESHCKIYELESRLKKNQYLSNDCLPNFLDALVLKALKAANSIPENILEIPKREIYPSFYHWYILMRQFADRTLDHWLKNYSASKYNDETVSEVVRIVSKKNKIKAKILELERDGEEQISVPIRFFSECDLKHFGPKPKNKDSIKSTNKECLLMKKTSETEKKILINEDEKTEYLMSIKLNSESQEDCETIKRIFELLKEKFNVNESENLVHETF